MITLLTNIAFGFFLGFGGTAIIAILLMLFTSGDYRHERITNFSIQLAIFSAVLLILAFCLTVIVGLWYVL